MARSRTIRLIASALAACSLVGGAATARDADDRAAAPVPPVVQSGFSRATPYDSLQRFLSELVRMRVPGLTLSVEELARTRQGRSVMLVRVRRGAVRPAVRVLLFAQQHGDEPAGKEALTLLLGRLASGTVDPALLDSLDLMIVPQMNPDGAQCDRRTTSDSLDLNRQHAVLGSPEVLGLHRLFLKEMPQVTLDMHEYASWSQSWAKAGIRRRADVQLGMITNPNCSRRIVAYQHDSVFSFIARRMRREGFAFQEYMVGSPLERLRYSTTEFNDGRQSFGMLGTLSFIQEGRRWKEHADSLRRRAMSQLASVEGLLAFAAAHAGEIRALVEAERAALPGLAPRRKDSGKPEHAAPPFVLRMEHFPADNAPEIPVTRIPSGLDTAWRVAPFHGTVRALGATTLPSAYVIPAERQDIIGLLALHGIRSERLPEPREALAERFLIDSVTVDTVEEDPVQHPWLRGETVKVTLHAGDVLVPMDQLHVLFLATLLEPGSVWGLAKYPAFGLLEAGSRYPILRIL